MFDVLHNRREFVRVGLLGLGGLTLADQLRASAPGESGPYTRDVSVVFLFLAGGPSQYETFDPKPGNPEGSTSIAGHIPTSIPGVRFASYLPKLAKLADQLTIVKSFQTKHAEHNGAHKQLLTADLTVQDGKPITEPGLGAVYSRIAGAMNPITGMPRHALIPPTTRNKAGRAGFNGSFESVVEGCQPAGLGTAFAPFEVLAPLAGGLVEEKKGKKKNVPDEPNPFLDVLEPRISSLELDGRMDLLRQMDQLDRRIDTNGGMDRLDTFRRQAVDLIRSGGVRNALDLSLEDASTLKAYDTEHLPNRN